MKVTDSSRYVGVFLKENQAHLSVQNWRRRFFSPPAAVFWSYGGRMYTTENIKHPHGGSMVGTKLRIPSKRRENRRGTVINADHVGNVIIIIRSQTPFFSRVTS